MEPPGTRTKAYARRAARELAPLPVGVAPVEPVKAKTEVIHHYDTDAAAVRQKEGIRKIMEELSKPGSH